MNFVMLCSSPYAFSALGYAGLVFSLQSEALLNLLSNDWMGLGLHFSTMASLKNDHICYKFYTDITYLLNVAILSCCLFKMYISRITVLLLHILLNSP